MNSFKHVLVMLLLPSFIFAAPQKLEVDILKSKVTWKGNKLIGSHDGVLSLKKGHIIVDGDDIMSGEFILNMSSIENKDMLNSPKEKDKLEGHLKSADFFNVSKYPVGTFKITSSEKNASMTIVNGELTIKGLSAPVIIPAKISKKENIYFATANLKIDRTLWGIQYNSKKFFDPLKLGDKLIYDDIEIGLYIEAS